MTRYALAVFEPDPYESTCVIMYYCCHRNGPDSDPSESIWVVPGTWNLED